MMLWFTQDQVNEIVRHAKAMRPDEACGIIAGSGNRVNRVIHVQNVADHPTCRYRIDERDLGKHLPELLSNGDAILGFYHSHPDSAPIPSETDIQEWLWGDAICLIVGLKNRRAALAAWRFSPSGVDRVPVHIGSTPPQVITIPLSEIQKTAVLLGGILVTVIMILLSIHLLPPAPPIP